MNSLFEVTLVSTHVSVIAVAFGMLVVGLAIMGHGLWRLKNDKR